MSFAQFILDRHFGDVSAPLKIENKPSEVVHEKKKKVKRERFVSLRNKHCARCCGVNQREHGWMVNKTLGGKTYMIGANYETFLRARIAQKIYDYWLTKGFTVEQIPRNITREYHQCGKRKS